MTDELFHVIAAIIRRHTRDRATIPLVTRFDPHDKQTSSPQPFLFQRVVGSRREVFSSTTVVHILGQLCAELAEHHREFAQAKFTPHDFRRLLATDLVNSGLPIHEYRPASGSEWREFEEHFDKRKVELGNCGRPYGTPCPHEHACLRCPVLQIDPKMLPRLDELEDDLTARRARALREGWLGEIEGVDLTLTFLRQKREQAQRHRRTTVILGLPARPGAVEDTKP